MPGGPPAMVSRSHSAISSGVSSSIMSRLRQMQGCGKSRGKTDTEEPTHDARPRNNQTAYFLDTSSNSGRRGFPENKRSEFEINDFLMIMGLAWTLLTRGAARAWRTPGDREA